MSSISKDIFGRVEKTKMSGTDNEIDEFNQRIADYNADMELLILDIKSASNKLNNNMQQRDVDIEKIMDKYKEIYQGYYDLIDSGTVKSINESSIYQPEKQLGEISVSDQAELLENLNAHASEPFINPKNAISYQEGDGSYPNSSSIVNYKNFKLFNDMGMSKEFSEIPIALTKFNEDTMYKHATNSSIKIKKDGNLKAVEFGFSIVQYNKSHFTDEEFDYVNNKYIGDPENANIIHRFYRGVLFFSNLLNDSDNLKVSAYIICPDNDISESNETTIGPEIKMSFHQDDDNIYITFDRFRPYKLDWKENELGDPDIFDMYSRNRASSSHINFEVFSFFNDLTSWTENNLLITEYEVTGENIKYIDELNIEPLKEGFIKYIGMDPYSASVPVTTEQKEFTFFSHEITETFKDITFNNIKEDHIYDFYDEIMSTRFIPNDKISSPDPIIINDIMCDDGDIYLATNYGIYKKDNNIKTIVNLTKGWINENTDNNYLLLSRDLDGNLVTFNKSIGKVVGTNEDFYDTSISLKTLDIDVNNILINSKGIKFIKSNNKFCVYTTTGVYLLKHDLTEFELIQNYNTNFTINTADIMNRFYEDDKNVYLVGKNSYYIIKSDINELRIFTTNFLNLNSINFPFIIKNIFINKSTFIILIKRESNNDIYLFEVSKNHIPLNASKITHLSLYIKNNNLNLIGDPNSDLLTYIGYKGTGQQLTGITNLKFEDIINSSIGFANGNEFKIQKINNVESTRLNSYTYDNKNIISTDLDSGEFLYYTNGKLIKCIPYQYNQTQTIDQIKEKIRKLLIEEKSVRGTKTPIPYHAQIYAKLLDDDLNDEFNISSVLDEIGVFNNYESTLFDEYMTPRYLFIIDKEKRNVGYMSSAKNYPFYNIAKNRNKTHRVNIVGGFKKLPDVDYSNENFSIYIGMDNELYGIGNNTYNIISTQESEATIFETPKMIERINGIMDKVYVYNNYILVKNTDKKYYIKGLFNGVKYNNFTLLELPEYNITDCVVNDNCILFYNETSIILSVGAIESYFVVGSIGIGTGIMYKNTLDLNTILSPTMSEIINIIQLHSGFIVLDSNKKLYKFSSSRSSIIETTGFIIKDIISVQDNNINTILENNLYNVFYAVAMDNRIYEFKNNAFTLINVDQDNPNIKFNKLIQAGSGFIIIEDNLGDKRIKGLCNGYHSISSSYSAFQKINENPKLNDSKIIDSYIYKDRSFLITEDSILVMCDSEYGAGNGLKGPFNKVISLDLDILPFTKDSIKDIHFTDTSTYIHTTNNDLYVTGMNLLTNTESLHFTLINSNIIKLWYSDDRIIVLKYEDNKNVLYGIGSNQNGKLGLGNQIQSVNVFTPLGDINNNELESVNKVYIFNTCTFVLMHSGQVLSCGLNTYGQLGNNKDETQWVFEYSEIGKCTNIIIDNKEKNTGFICTDGLYVCGANDTGLLGILNINDHTLGYILTPQKISNNVETVVFGEKVTLVFTKDKYVKFFYNYEMTHTYNGIPVDTDKNIGYIIKKGFCTFFRDEEHNLDKEVFYLLTYDKKLISIDVSINTDYANTYPVLIDNSISYNMVVDLNNEFIDLVILNNEFVKVSSIDNIPGVYTRFNYINKEIPKSGSYCGDKIYTILDSPFNFISSFLGSNGFDETKEVISHQMIYETDDENKTKYTIGDIKNDKSVIYNKRKYSKIKRLLGDLDISLDDRCKFTIKLSILPFEVELSEVIANVNGENDLVGEYVEIIEK